MRQEPTLESLLNRAATYCAMGERCLSQIKEKLFAWGANASQAEQIMDYLVDNDYTNETRYAHAFTHDKVRFQHWGRVKIQAALTQKRVDRSAVREALEDINEEEYRESLRHLVEQKRRTTEERDKLLRFLAGHGFTYDEICDVLDENED